MIAQHLQELSLGLDKKRSSQGLWGKVRYHRSFSMDLFSWTAWEDMQGSTPNPCTVTQDACSVESGFRSLRARLLGRCDTRIMFVLCETGVCHYVVTDT